MDMHWIENSLGRLERQLRELIEGKPGSHGNPGKFAQQLERELLTAMESEVGATPLGSFPAGGSPLAPDEYTLLLPRQEAEQLLTHPGEITRLTDRLKVSAADHGYLFNCEPVLKVVAVPELEKIKVLVEFSQNSLGDSRTSIVKDCSEKPSQPIPGSLPKAFLIINGLHTCQLKSPVVNLGRDPANQVCIDDARVSRMHAQLRVIQGRYVIFDLDSTGGTFVNGTSVKQQALNPGDVILLAGVPLVYGQDQDAPSSLTQEMAAASPPPELL